MTFSADISGDLADMIAESYEKLPRRERVGLRSVQDYVRRLLCDAVSEKLEEQDRDA